MSCLHRLWRLRSRRRSGCGSPSRTRLRSPVIGGPAPLGQTGRPPQTPRAPRPRQPVHQTSPTQTPTPAPHHHHHHLTLTRSNHQTRCQSMESLRPAALQLTEEQSQSHHQVVCSGLQSEVRFFVFVWILLLIPHGSSYSVFEDEGVEMPPTASQPAEEADKPGSSPNPAESVATGGEEAEQQPTQPHSGTGQDLSLLVSLVNNTVFLLRL